MDPGSNPQVRYTAARYERPLCATQWPGDNGFGTHPDDSDVREKAETRSDGSKAGAQARGTSRCTWPVAGVRVRDDEVSWEDSGSVDCDSQDQNSYSDEEESYDPNAMRTKRGGPRINVKKNKW